MVEINCACPSADGNYSKLIDDPEALLQFVDKHVKVQLIKNSSLTGFVHSIDPVSNSIIISAPQEDSYQTVLVPGHAILDITETITNINPPAKKILALDANSNMERKEKILKWLKWNLLPITEDGDKIVFGNASLLPPYSVMDICTDNPMVAIQMRKIIEKMPLEFES